VTAAAGAPVVITGLGALTPLGPDVPALEEGLLSGRSGARLLDEPEFADLPRASRPPSTSRPLERVEARTLDRVQQVALVAAVRRGPTPAPPRSSRPGSRSSSARASAAR
jgi:3-oxoacyl-[acyl-carrier-protein] synthase II